MRSFNRPLVLLAAVAAIAWSSPAGATTDAELTFSFRDLVSDFDSSGGSLLFTASDRSQTIGDITQQNPLSVAVFNGASATDFFSLEMNISEVTGVDPALILFGEGSLTITDVGGDTISSNAINGYWVNNGSTFFAGRIQEPVITSNDDEFNGTSGAVSLDGLTGPVAESDFNTVTMAFGSWFTDSGGDFTSFSNVSTLAQGSVVPEPATVCLLAFGTLLIAGRWRRSIRTPSRS